jgi:pentatricopeptide repeat protein
MFSKFSSRPPPLSSKSFRLTFSTPPTHSLRNFHLLSFFSCRHNDFLPRPLLNSFSLNSFSSESSPSPLPSKPPLKSRPSIRPSPKVYLDQIHSLIQNGRPSEAEEVLSQMIAAQYRPTLSTINLILKSYSKRLQPENGEKLWKEMHNKFQLVPDAMTYTSLMSGYAAICNFQSCLRLLEEMKVSHIRPNVYIYTTLIAAYSRAHLPQQAEAYLLEMIQNGVVPSIASYNSVIYGYIISSQPLEAYRLFLELYHSSILSPDRVSFSTLLKGLLENNHPTEIEQIYSLMEIKSKELSSTISSPTQKMYHQLIQCYCQTSQPLLAHRCMTNLISSGSMDPSIFTYSILIMKFIEIGDYSKIDILLEEMRSHERKIRINGITYEMIISSLCKKQRPDLAKKYHWEMIGKNFIPSQQCLGSFMKAYSVMKQPQQAENFLHEVITCTHTACRPPTRSCYRILITSYCISSQPMEAERVSIKLKSFQGRRLEKYLYSCLIKAYVRTGYPSEAERVFRVMLSEYQSFQDQTQQQEQESEEVEEEGKLLNNNLTQSESSLTAMYNQLMKGYLADCSIDNMLRVFEEMKSYYPPHPDIPQIGSIPDGFPNVSTYHYLMRYHCRVLNPMEAEKLLSEMIQYSKDSSSIPCFPHLTPEKLSYDIVLSGYDKIGIKKVLQQTTA